jgi:hypothetical protein
MYFEQLERKYREIALGPDRPPEQFVQEEEGSDGRRGRVFGNLILMAEPFRAFLRVSERVTVVGQHIRRLDYGYFLIVDDEEVWGYERDPSHHPAEHGHIVGHERVAADRVTFDQVVGWAWDYVTERSGGCCLKEPVAFQRTLVAPSCVDRSSSAR